MTSRIRLLAMALLMPLAGVATANTLTDIVWDGFSYPRSADSTEVCDEQRYPSCRLLFSDDYQARFADKLKSIVDDRYRFVNFADEERGETLHLTITINLEWSVGQPATNSKPNRYDLRYTLCSTLMLYRAGPSTYTLENAAARCSSEFYGDQAADLDGFLREFTFGKASEKTVNLEDTWLAEASSLISRRRNEFKRIAVREVELSDGLFVGNDVARDKLRLYLAEKMSADLSQALRKPVIPPALSGNGQVALRFRDTSRNRDIRLPTAAHMLTVKILPFQRKLTAGPLKGQQLETFFSIFSVTHHDALGGSHLNGSGFYLGTRPRIVVGPAEDADVDRVIARISENVNLELLGNLSSEFAQQLSRPDRHWVDNRAYKTDAAAAFRGLSALAKDLSK